MGKGALGRRVTAVQLCEKIHMRRRGCFFLVLYPQMRSSFPISTLSNWEAGREDYSRGLIRRYFFPFVASP